MENTSRYRRHRRNTRTHAIQTGVLLLLILYAASGCGGDSTSSPTGPKTDTSRIVTVHAGNQQTARVGEAVPIPPSVRVTNSTGVAVAGASVSFTVTAGNGSVEGGNATTGSDGVAAVGAWTMGTAGANTLSATVSGATSGSPATFSATAEELVIVTINAGDGQSGEVGRAVPVPPSVRVENSLGAPVAGINVTFSVTAGGGTLEGESTTTGQDGVATVGAWILGEAGENMLTATVEGATSGSPSTFSATAEAVVIAPAADTTLTGSVTATRLLIPEGVTVTVTEDLTLTTTDFIEIRGALTGACVPVQLDAGGPLTIRGTIDNSCAGGDPTADLTLIARGGYDLEATSIQSSGDVWLTNDPTLADTDFPAAVAGAPPARNGAADQSLLGPGSTAPSLNSSAVGCRIDTAILQPFPSKARKGTDRTGTGLAGADGRKWQIDCRGELRIESAVRYEGQHGGDGGEGTHSPAVVDAYAEGGPGGKGGDLILRGTQRVSFNGVLNEIISGAGGRGGDATATSSPSGNGVAGPGADAVGGAGGEPGLFAIRSPSIEFNEVVDLVIGPAGDGGIASSTSADGLDAEGTSFAQAGGPASARGGVGGGTPDLTLAARNGVEITGTDNARVSGGDGGSGGAAQVFGGTGGKGSSLRPNGGTGGTSEAIGGPGGTALLKDHRMSPFGAGGNGGDALISGSKGGDGLDRCTLPDPFQLGGSGGSGGNLIGQHGDPGNGATTGTQGFIQLSGAGNGGDAGNGEPAGTAGSGGSRTMSAPPQTVGHNTIAGGKGFECVRPNAVLITSTTQNSQNLDPNFPCPQQSSTFGLVSFTPHPVGYTILVNGVPTFAVQPDDGVIPAAPGATTPWVSVPVQTFHDICTMVTSGPDVIGEIEVRFSLGEWWLTKTIPLEYYFR